METNRSYDVKEGIDEVIAEIDSIRERLVEDSTHRPLKLLGLTASFDLMNQIYTGLATILLGVAQQELG